MRLPSGLWDLVVFSTNNSLSLLQNLNFTLADECSVNTAVRDAGLSTSTTSSSDVVFGASPRTVPVAPTVRARGAVRTACGI